MNQKKTTILVIDDEPHIQKMLGILLDVQNYKIIDCLSGKQGIRMAATIKPDLILLDTGLPDIDGNQVLEAIREWSQVPIIVLSACSIDEEIIKAFHIGANDYITKPFNVEILLARINAALRCTAINEMGGAELYNGHIKMDLVRHEVFINNKLTAFTPKEYDLLRFFLINNGKMLTHKEILKAIWGAAHADDTTYLRVYIGQIRSKIETDPTKPTIIKTEPSIGYRMEPIHSNSFEEA